MRTQRAQQSPDPTSPAFTGIGADVFTGPIGLDQDYGFAVQAIWTGASLQGTIKLQATVDGVTWSDISGTAQTVNGPGSFLWNVNGAFYFKVRAYFSWSSGTGALVVWSQVKGP